jgi:hypothetical protein
VHFCRRDLDKSAAAAILDAIPQSIIRNRASVRWESQGSSVRALAARMI